MECLPRRPFRLCTALVYVANTTVLPVMGQRRTPDATQRATASALLAPDLDDTRALVALLP